MGHHMRQFIRELEARQMSNDQILKEAFQDEARRQARGLMSDTYNLDCSRNVPSEPFKDELKQPPLPTIDYTAARYERRPDNGNRNRSTDPKVSANVKAGIDATLDERGKRYGSYAEKAAIIQQMKESMRGGSSWAGMAPDMKESLEMVVHKIGRIVTGDVNYHDNWHDLIGYTKLVADRLQGVAR